MLVSSFGCVFKVPEAFQNLINQVEDTLKHALEEEEKVPVSDVINFDEVCNKFLGKLFVLPIDGIVCNF
jgi:DNA polymerase epsilon subunit 1